MQPSEHMRPDLTDTRGFVLYDGTCGMCSTGIARWREKLHRWGFVVRPLQEPWVREFIPAPQDGVYRDVAFITPDLRVFYGPDVYRQIAKEASPLYPLYLLSRLPALSSLFDFLYRLVANNRFTISRVCKLSPELDVEP